MITPERAVQDSTDDRPDVRAEVHADDRADVRADVRADDRSAGPSRVNSGLGSGRPDDLRSDRLVIGAVAVCVWIAGSMGVAAAPQLLDSAELAAASFQLGVAHPPGEPLPLLLGRAFAFLPLGSVALRVGLTQAFAGAVAAALVAWFALRSIDASVAAPARRLLAAAGGLVFGFAPGVLGSSLRPEVYALATALALGSLALAQTSVRRNDARLALLAALGIGLGLTTHPLVAGLTGLGAVAAAWPWLRTHAGPQSKPGALRLISASVAALLVGAMVIVYLPLRSAVLLERADADAVSWGDARTPAGLWWILSARTFAAKSSVVHGSSDPTAVPFVLMQELSLPVVILALLGAYAGVRVRSARRETIAVLVAVAGAVGAALIGGFDPANPDIRGYLGVALALVAALAAVGVGAALGQLRRPRFQRAIASVAVVAVAVGAGLSFGPARARWGRAADALTGELLASLPPRAVLLTGHFETAFLVAYARGVEGRRPDVVWGHLGFARGPGYSERVGERDADLASLLDAHAVGPLGADQVAAVARRRPVRLEPSGDLSAALVRQIQPAGLTWSFGPPLGNPIFPVPTLPSALETLLDEEARTSPQVDGMVAFRAFADADRACQAGRPDARLRVGSLLLQRSHDAMVQELARRCPP